MTLIGVALLYFRWCRHTASQSWWTAAGWSLLLLAILPWNLAHSAEFSVMYMFLVPGIFAWVFVARQWLLIANQKGGNDSSKQNLPKKTFAEHQPVVTSLQLAHAKRWGMLLLRSIVILPYAGTVSLLATVALTDLIPWTKNNTLVTALLCGALVWGVIASWLLAQTSLLRPILVMAVVGLLSALYLCG